MNKDLEVAVKTFLAYGKPCEGSFGYHDAWKKLEEIYYHEKASKEIDIALKSIEENKKINVESFKGYDINYEPLNDGWRNS